MVQTSAAVASVNLNLVWWLTELLIGCVLLSVAGRLKTPEKYPSKSDKSKTRTRTNVTCGTQPGLKPKLSEQESWPPLLSSSSSWRSAASTGWWLPCQPPVSCRDTCSKLLSTNYNYWYELWPLEKWICLLTWVFFSVHLHLLHSSLDSSSLFTWVFFTLLLILLHSSPKSFF